MNLRIEEIITLDDGKDYIVASYARHNGNIYYCFIDNEPSNKIKYYQENNDSLALVENQELINNLIPIFAQNANYIFKAVLENEILDYE